MDGSHNEKKSVEANLNRPIIKIPLSKITSWEPITPNSAKIDL